VRIESSDIHSNSTHASDGRILKLESSRHLARPAQLLYRLTVTYGALFCAAVYFANKNKYPLSLIDPRDKIGL